MERKIWFVRHAQSEYNKKKIFTGWHDPELTEHGIHKAHDLKEELYDIKFDYAFSSPLKRAHSTAKILVDEVEIVVDDRLKERSYGDWSALSKQEVKEMVGEENYYAARRGWESHPPNGESLKDVSIRVKPFIDDLPDNGNILVVSHGNTIRAISVLFGINTVDNVNSFEIKVGTVLKV
ncbi:MAG: 2,3-bisphosphoglycerate-dependent phosphoglycerate mutase [Gammaproteobacteria bacterium]|nr:2,3-bisphosphoglycerate-dependent phosphoglycerate mutase [Gammaproteobacteria bacterium]|tara:strand:- start:98 stop:634 length:537 start_codon:yes stop_codon:yes gene_type:complete